MDKMKVVTYREIEAILSKIDKKDFYEISPKIPDDDPLIAAKFDFLYQIKDIPKYTVLGIDIYKYSQFPLLEQSLIPFIFKLLSSEAIKFCTIGDQFVFQKYILSDFDKFFISTGDGGFQIFPTPIHALIYALNFQLVLRAYNSYHLFPKLRRFIGPINLRYAITYDKIFSFDNNYFGPGIINNSRILNKDSLNRCLIDSNTFEWFMLNMNGVEDLQFTTLDNIFKMHDFSTYDVSYADPSHKNVVFPRELKERSIKNCDILQIGEIEVKNTKLFIYNLHVQFMCEIADEQNTLNKTRMTISLGNINTSGIII